MAKEVKQWITIKGRHIPIFEGETVKDAVKRMTEKGKVNQPHTHDSLRKKAQEHKKAVDEYKKTPWKAGSVERKIEADDKFRKESEKGVIKSAKFKKHNAEDFKYKGTGNKESLASNKESSIMPSRELGQSLYSGSKTGISQELNKLEDGTKVHFRVNGISRTYTKDGKSFVDESGNSRKRTDVADLLHRSWKHGKDKTLHDFYENNLKITGPSKKEEYKPEHSTNDNSDTLNGKPIKSEMNSLYTLTGGKRDLTDAHVGRINKFIEDYNANPDKYAAYKGAVNRVKKYVNENDAEGKRFGKFKEKTWQDKDEEIKQKQIENANKQKVERNEEQEKFLEQENRKALKQYQDWESQKKKELHDLENTSKYRMLRWNENEEEKRAIEKQHKELEDAIKKNHDEAQKIVKEMQSKGQLPKYSQTNENGEAGYILEDTVMKDPRYKKALETLPNSFKKHHLSDMVRRMMYAEEQGKTTFQDIVYDFYGGDRRDYTEKTAHYKNKDGMGYDNFGQFLNDYKKVYKELGYKVTASENRDSHRRGYRTARGGWQSASHSQARLLTLEKIEEKVKKNK